MTQSDSGSNDDTTDTDFDTDNTGEFDQSELLCEHNIDPQKSHYILHLSITNETDPYLTAAQSDGSASVFQLENRHHFTKIYDAPNDDNRSTTSCGVKFHNTNRNLFYLASKSNVTVWDLRLDKERGPVTVFRDTTTVNAERQLSCFDVSFDDQIVCAGTDIFEDDAFVLFWDIRRAEFLGGYWESHTDDLTQVQFHPSDGRRLISASMDGLINTYDLMEANEENALIETFNTGESIEKLRWHNDDDVFCTTHASEVQLWRSDCAQPLLHRTRRHIADGIKRHNEDFAYIVNIHQSNREKFVLAGSNHGRSECLRSFKIDRKSKKLGLRDFCGNQQLVRCSATISDYDLIITGGENGVLNAWKTA